MFLGYNDSQVQEFYDKIALKQPLGGVIEPEEILIWLVNFWSLMEADRNILSEPSFFLDKLMKNLLTTINDKFFGQLSGFFKNFLASRLGRWYKLIKKASRSAKRGRLT